MGVILILNKLKIRRICKKYRIENYTINDDLSIDVNGYVNFLDKGLTKLPLRFNKVSRNFDCSGNKLESFEGFPKEVDGIVHLNRCGIKSLTQLPDVDCQVINLTNNQIRDFDGFEKIKGCMRASFKGNPIHGIWNRISVLGSFSCFDLRNKIELFQDYDIIRGGEVIVLDRLNEFLEVIDRDPIKNHQHRLFKGYTLIGNHWRRK